VVAGDTLETISQALADSVNADTGATWRPTRARRHRHRQQGEHAADTFSIGPKVTALTPNRRRRSEVARRCRARGRRRDLDGEPDSDFGAGPVTTTHSYVVRSTVPLAEVAAGLAPRSMRPAPASSPASTATRW